MVRSQSFRGKSCPMTFVPFTSIHTLLIGILIKLLLNHPGRQRQNIHTEEAMDLQRAACSKLSALFLRNHTSLNLFPMSFEKRKFLYRFLREVLDYFTINVFFIGESNPSSELAAPTA